MSISASILKVPEPTASPAARWTLIARVAAAGTLVLAAGLQLAANSIGAQRAARSTRSGGSPTTRTWQTWRACPPCSRCRSI